MGVKVLQCFPWSRLSKERSSRSRQGPAQTGKGAALPEFYSSSSKENGVTAMLCKLLFLAVKCFMPWISYFFCPNGRSPPHRKRPHTPIGPALHSVGEMQSRFQELRPVSLTQKAHICLRHRMDNHVIDSTN